MDDVSAAVSGWILLLGLMARNHFFASLKKDGHIETTQTISRWD
jgi:hypothetical protein